MPLLSSLLFGAALLGLVALLIQRLAMERALRRPFALPRRHPGISILKPLCGADDELEENLAAFAALDYPRYEVLLGVRDERDAAWPLAQQAARRWPQVFRVLRQQGAPGLNPKVNQLATLERAARYELLLVSDSNTRPPPGYLSELAGLFDDAQVGCVSSAITGGGHLSFGALLDNLHLASSVGAGQLAAKQLADRDLVVGKSMALRREAIAALGGFAAYANVLAEDYVIGRDVTGKLGLRVAIARRPVVNVAVHRSVGSFFRRYLRWGVIHRTAVRLPTSLCQGLLNPWPLTILAWLAAPSRAAAGFSLGCLGVKAAIDLSAAARLGCSLSLAAVPAVPVKDLLLFVGWANGLVSRTVDWRGTRLRVGDGSRLLPAEVSVAASPIPGVAS
jgi:ceramide glucosyltransferase